MNVLELTDSELTKLKEMVCQWIDEGFGWRSPYHDYYRIFAALGITQADVEHDLRMPANVDDGEGA